MRNSYWALRCRQMIHDDPDLSDAEKGRYFQYLVYQQWAGRYQCYFRKQAPYYQRYLKLAVRGLLWLYPCHIYKVYAGDLGYLFIAAQNRSDARQLYWQEATDMPEEDMYIANTDMHCFLIERNTEFLPGECTRRYIESRYFDLVQADIIDPEWIREKYENFEGWSLE